MRISPPILSEDVTDLSLPGSLTKLVAQNSVPSSADLSALAAHLSALVGATEARARALKRDIELLNESYQGLRRHVEGQSKRSVEDVVPGESLSSHAVERVSADEYVATADTALASEDFDDVQQHQHAGIKGPNTEELKAKLGVASYPTDDLKDLMPGTPSVEDYSKVKIPNQIAITTFYTSVEPYFRTLTEEDLGWLRDRGDELTPFIIPPLGTHYLELWQDSGDSPPPRQESTQAAREDANALTDDNVMGEAVSCGPLTSRLLSALLKEDELQTNSDDDDSATREPKSLQASSVKLSYVELEEQVNAELTHIGLLEHGPVNWSQAADDEISSELRSLQEELKARMSRNQAMKRKLIDLAQDEMSKDEYQTILDDLDKQVEQAYLKSSRNAKGKKRKAASSDKTAGVSKGPVISSNLKSLLEKRQKWVDNIGPVVDYGRRRIVDGIYNDIK